MIKFLNLLSDIVDPNWWVEVVSKKSGLHSLVSKTNKFKEWKLKQPLWKQTFIEVLMYTLLALALEPVLNMLGYSMLPWRWF